MTEQKAKNLVRRLTASIVAIILLTAALSVTTFVLIYTSLSEEGSLFFTTGNVRLNLNDGKPVITDSECLFAPGSQVEKQFTVENLSTCAVWYKFYFTNISGSIADDISIEIRDGDNVLMQGKMSELTEKNTAAADKALDVGEKKTLTIIFRFDEDAGNDKQGLLLSFDINAKAVQTKNNPDKKFN